MKKMSAKQHKNSELFDILKEQINSSILKAGERLPTELQLAQQYNCSRSTIRSSLKRLEELKLVERVRGSGTYVSRQIKEKRPRRNIGILIPMSSVEVDLPSDSYFSQIIAGLQLDYGDTRCGFNLLKMGSEESIETFFSRTDFHLEDFDGFICFFHSINDEDVAFMRGESIPFIATTPSTGSEYISYIAIDNSYGVYSATNHLLSTGKKKVGFLHGTASSDITQSRLEGFERALKENAIEYNDGMHFELIINDKERAEMLCQKCVDEGFDALIVCGDCGILRVFQSLKKIGVRIPEDMGIVMYDDIPWLEKVLEPAVTAVRQPFMDQARRMLRVLINEIDGKEDATVIEILKPELIVRESCGALSEGGKANAHAKKKIFTLIELLVILSVISFLISFLVPALNKVREDAKRSQCVSNQKEIGISFSYYSADHNGYYPTPFLTENGNYWSNLLYSLYSSDKGLVKNGTGTAYGTGETVPNYIDRLDYTMQGCVYEEGTIFHCPSAFKKQALGSNIVRDYYHSYTINSYLGVKPWFPAKVYNIQKPSEVYVTMDENSGVYLGMWDFWGYPSISLSKYFHDEGRNVLFGDGHVGYMDNSDFPHWSVKSEREPFWYGQ